MQICHNTTTMSFTFTKNKWTIISTSSYWPATPPSPTHLKRGKKKPSRWVKCLKKCSWKEVNNCNNDNGNPTLLRWIHNRAKAPRWTCMLSSLTWRCAHATIAVKQDTSLALARNCENLEVAPFSTQSPVEPTTPHLILLPSTKFPSPQPHPLLQSLRPHKVPEIHHGWLKRPRPTTWTCLSPRLASSPLRDLREKTRPSRERYLLSYGPLFFFFFPHISFS